MKTDCILLTTVAILLHGVIPGQGQGTLLAQHSGTNNPVSEGFALAAFGIPQVGPAVSDLGVDAWTTRISAAGVSYHRGLPNLVGLDWELSVVLRVVEDEPAVRVFFAGLNTGQVSFYLHFGLDTNGDPSVQVIGSSLSPVLALEGASSTYHNYQLVYSAAAGVATLRVDGLERLNGLSGGAGSSPLLAFGGHEELEPMMQANWHLVSLQLIPEPSSLALLVLGGGSLWAGRCRRMRRWSRPNETCQTMD